MTAFNGNPQLTAMTLLQKNAKNNPMFANLLALAQQGNTAEIEAIVRNMCQEKGIDFEKEFASFKQNFGL